MSGNIFIKGCEVSPEGNSLDPCSCEYYYDNSRRLEPVQRKCGPSTLWDHTKQQCRDKDAILQSRLCDPDQPWNRCINNREDQLRVVRNRCIKDGSFISTNGDGDSDTGFIGDSGISSSRDYTGRRLPSDIQNANIGLVLLATLAGAVIALMLAALIFTLRGNCTYGFKELKKLKSVRSRSSSSQKKKRTKKIEVVTEGDNISLNYEDINEDNVHDGKQQGYSPMKLEVPVAGYNSNNRQVVKKVKVTKTRTTTDQTKPSLTQKIVSETTHQQQSKSSSSSGPFPVNQTRPLPLTPAAASQTNKFTVSSKGAPATPIKPSTSSAHNANLRPTPPPTRHQEPVIKTASKKEPLKPMRPNFPPR